MSKFQDIFKKMNLEWSNSFSTLKNACIDEVVKREEEDFQQINKKIELQKPNDLAIKIECLDRGITLVSFNKLSFKLNTELMFSLDDLRLQCEDVFGRITKQWGNGCYLLDNDWFNESDPKKVKENNKRFISLMKQMKQNPEQLNERIDLLNELVMPEGLAMKTDCLDLGITLVLFNESPIKLDIEETILSYITTGKRMRIFHSEQKPFDFLEEGEY